MKHIATLTLLLVALILASCGTTSTVPLTGRKQRISVSDQQILSLSSQQYSQYMASAKKVTGTTQAAMVQRVGQRLAGVVTDYLNANGYAADARNFSWEFNLVSNPEFNAFCMPGGKIVVYTGLFQYAKTEEELAIVLGHEIAHAVAKHSAEKISQQQRAQTGANIIGAVLSTKSQAAQQLGSLAVSFGANSVLRKFSRKDESEADYMGLIFAAMAGYNPQAAVDFWTRVAQNSSSSKSAFFSDHPTDAQRVRDLTARMPEALKYYKPAAAPAATTKKSSATAKKSSAAKKTTTKKATTTRKK